MGKFCVSCGSEIPEARIKATKGKSKTCVKCSNVGRVAGHPIISGKTTYAELQILPQETAAHLHHLGSRKGQSPPNGVRMKGH